MKLLIKKMEGCEDLPLPKYYSKHAAGFDLHAAVEHEEMLKPGERKIISAGIKIEIPPGYFGMVTPRSGNAKKFGISKVNTPGIIDSDYRGPIGINLINHGREDFVIKRGDRIAQVIIVPYQQMEIKEAAELSQTERGEDGFGSTGR